MQTLKQYYKTKLTERRKIRKSDDYLVEKLFVNLREDEFIRGGVLCEGRS